MPVEEESLKESVLWVLDLESELVGSGWLISPDSAITCAHVASLALGLEADNLANLEGHSFTVQLPHLKLVGRATVTVWHFQGNSVPNRDLAELSIVWSDKQTILMDLESGFEVSISKLGLRDSIFYFGFLDGKPFPVGIEAVTSPQFSNNPVQIECIGEYSVENGHSGAPVWNRSQGGICGIVVLLDPSEDHNVGWMIPLRGILEVVSGPTSFLLHRALVDDPTSSSKGGLAQDNELIKFQSIRIDDSNQTQIRKLGTPPIVMGLNFFNREIHLSNLVDLIRDPSVRVINVHGPAGVGKTALICAALEALVPEEGDPTAIVYPPFRGFDSPIDEQIIGLVLRELPRSAQTQWAAIPANPEERLAVLFRLLGSLRLAIYFAPSDQASRSGKQLDSATLMTVEELCRLGLGHTLIIESQGKIQPREEHRKFFVWHELSEGLPRETAIDFLRKLDSDNTLGLKSSPDSLLSEIVDLCSSVPSRLERVSTLLSAGIGIDNLPAHIDEINGPLNEDARLALLSESEREVANLLAVSSIPIGRELLDSVLPGLENGPGVLRQMAIRRIVRKTNDGYYLSDIDRDRILLELAQQTTNSLHWQLAEYYSFQSKEQTGWNSIEDVTPALIAADHFLRGNQAAKALAVFDNLDFDFLIRWGYSKTVVQFRRRLEKALTDPKHAAQNYIGLGRALLDLSQPSLALREFSQCRELMIRGSETHYRVLHYESLANVQKGDYRRAIELSSETFRLAKAAKDPLYLGRSLGAKGSALRFLGDASFATRTLKKGLLVAREIGDLRGRSRRLMFLGGLRFQQGRIAESESLISESIKLAQELKHLFGEGRAMSAMASVQLAKFELEDAASNLQESMRIAKEIPDWTGIGNALLTSARFSLEIGQAPTAEQNAAKALSIARRCGVRRLEGAAGVVHCLSKALQGQHEVRSEALGFISILEKIHALPALAQAKMSLGLIWLTTGRFDQAKQYFESAVTAAIEAGCADLKKEASAYSAICSVALGHNFIPGRWYGSQLPKTKILVSLARFLFAKRVNNQQAASRYGSQINRVLGTLSIESFPDAFVYSIVHTAMASNESSEGKRKFAKHSWHTQLSALKIALASQSTVNC